MGSQNKRRLQIRVCLYPFVIFWTKKEVIYTVYNAIHCGMILWADTTNFVSFKNIIANFFLIVSQYQQLHN